MTDISKIAAFEERAREMLTEQLSRHPDPDVRAMARTFGPSDESVSRVAAALARAHLEKEHD